MKSSTLIVSAGGKPVSFVNIETQKAMTACRRIGSLMHFQSVRSRLSFCFSEIIQFFETLQSLLELPDHSYPSLSVIAAFVHAALSIIWKSSRRFNK